MSIYTTPLPPGWYAKATVPFARAIPVVALSRWASLKTALAGIASLSWAGKFWATAFRIFLLEEVIGMLTSLTSSLYGGTLLVLANKRPDLAGAAVENIANAVTNLSPLTGVLAAKTIEQITGISIDESKLWGPDAPADRHDYQINLGNEFTQVVSGMLDVKGAQQDFLTRTGTAGSFTNLSSYFGTNLDFQLRSLTIGTVSSVLGWNSLRHLEGLHQSINWAFGFGWLSWSVLSNAMDVTVNAGVKRYYNSLVKPHDLSQSQANKLFIRRVLPLDTWHQIHANAGMRDDARDWQLALEFNQPSIADIRTGYDHNEVTPAQIDDMLIAHELTPEGAQLVKTQITNHRKWDLQNDVAKDKLRLYQKGWEPADLARTQLQANGWHAEEIDLAVAANARERIYHLREAVTREHMKFLRHGWETQDEARTWLASQGWSEEEIALAFEANRLEQKAAHIPQPKHLTVGEVATFVSAGSWDPIRGQQYLVNLGFSVDDANEILSDAILRHAVAVTPKKVRDACETSNHLLNFLEAAIASVTLLDPANVLKHKDFMDLVKCYIANLQTGGSGGSLPPPPVGPPAPTNLTALPISHGARLSWQPVQGLVDYVVYRRAIGSGFFISISPGSTSTTYDDTSALLNETYVYVVRSRANGVESTNSNEVIVVPVA